MLNYVKFNIYLSNWPLFPFYPITNITLVYKKILYVPLSTYVKVISAAIMNKTLQFPLFVLAICIYLFFYISAFETHTLNPFFAPIVVGQDFFQIPNGAYSFLHGGSLNGILPNGIPPYTACCAVNYNVYHPLFTILIGVPLQLFRPWPAFAVWIAVHFVVMTVLVIFLWNKYKTNKYLYLALSLLLLNSYHYYEIWHGQFHFLFNFFTILFLYESATKGDTKKAGLWLFLSLLSKPIGLLWIIPLLLYKRFVTVWLGFGLFVVITLFFTLTPFGSYYLQNFFFVAAATVPTHNIYAIHNLIPSFPLVLIKLTSMLVAIGLIILQITKKPPLFTIITLWIGYQLLFYTLVYHYQYTILAGIFCLGMLLDVFSPRKLIMIPMVFLTLPTPVIFFHLFGVATLSLRQYSIIWLYSACWLICFLIILVKTSLTKEKRSQLLSSRKE